MKTLALNVFFVSLLSTFISHANAKTWSVVNDSDTMKIERSDIVKKSENGFTGSFRKINKSSKEVIPLIINVDCVTKFYELKDMPKTGDDVSIISSGIANPDHKLFAYIDMAANNI